MLIDTALAEAAHHLEQPAYLAAAARAAEFIWTQMQDEQGFLRIHFRGKSTEAVQLKDYAFYLQALISLYDVQEDEGWHVNAHVPLDDHLIPTRVSVVDGTRWKLKEINYPQAERLSLGFSDTPLALYQGRSIIKARLDRNSMKTGLTKTGPVIQLHLQACNNSLCLPLETLKLYPRLSLLPTIEE